MKKLKKQTNYLLRHKSILSVICLCFLGLSPTVFGYKGPQHSYITETAVDNYQAWVALDEDLRVGSVAIAKYEGFLVWGSIHEDDGVRWLHHFWNPDGGLNDGLWLHDSAYTRATMLYGYVLDEYEDGNYGVAYNYLGQVLHLIEDMGTPAHTLLDPHPSGDWYESTYISNPANYPAETGLESGSTLYTLMLNLAETSDNYDSDDYNGEVTAGTYRPAPFTNFAGVTIANACFRGAIRAAGGFLKRFYATVKPSVVWYEPWTAWPHSGLNGVPLNAEAYSFRDTVSHTNDRISYVKFFYNTNDDESGSYVAAATLTSRDAGTDHFLGSWTNSINDSKVWIKLEAYDVGSCESTSSKGWISIDSTRPTVTNTRK
jgi:hypothetical protein